MSGMLYKCDGGDGGGGKFGCRKFQQEEGGGTPGGASVATIRGWFGLWGRGREGHCTDGLATVQDLLHDGPHRVDDRLAAAAVDEGGLPPRE